MGTNTTTQEREGLLGSDGTLPRAGRYLLRVPLLLLHLVVALPIAVLCTLPPGQKIHLRGVSLTEWAIRLWSGALVRIFGMRVRRLGQLHAGPVMLLANHMTWMDIEVLHSQRAVSFVAKSEIERWPVIGYLATAGGSVYHARGSSTSQAKVLEALSAKLAAGNSVAIFAEGRTGSGEEVLPFHGRMIKAAADLELPVQAVALGYYRAGELRNTEVAFAPRENFLQNFVRLLGAAPLEVDVLCMAPMATHGRGRRELAAIAREQVVQALETRRAA